MVRAPTCAGLLGLWLSRKPLKLSFLLPRIHVGGVVTGTTQLAQHRTNYCLMFSEDEKLS